MHKLNVFRKDQERKHYQHEDASGDDDNDNPVEVPNSKNYDCLLPKIFPELKSMPTKEQLSPLLMELHEKSMDSTNENCMVVNHW